MTRPAAPAVAAVDAGRMARDIEAIASFSEQDPAIGHSRPTFSAAWAEAREYVMRQAREAGCGVRVDAAGNLHARPAALGWEAPAWLCGSHIDSVPTGGKYDGVVGVVVALELLRAALWAPVELVVFAEEEGTTFGLGMLGSKAWAGTLEPAGLAAVRNVEGRSFLEAGAAYGVHAGRLASERLVPSRYLGLVEVHVEQGASMWRSGVPLAVVTAINGRRQYWCALQGAANHAGSTTMDDRRDALAGAAEIVCYLESLARDLADGAAHTVVTVGRIEVHPNALNVIPGSAAFSVDFRSPSEAVLDRGEERLQARLPKLAGARSLEIELTRTEVLPVVPMDRGVCDRLRQAAQQLDLELPGATSGALHDTAILAPLLPSAMLFVASRDGISHNPAEFSRIEHIALAARVLAEAFRP
jgi:hydantoinase/carbamoylase family amidase